MMLNQRQSMLLIAMALLGVAGLMTFLLMRSRGPSAEALAELALTAPSMQERQAAAAKLTDLGASALPQMRQVFEQSDAPEVRGICVEGLGRNWDYESLDAIISAMEDPSPDLRGRAGLIAGRMTGRDRPFFAHGPEAERRVIIEHVRQDWEEIRKSPYSGDLKRRLKESHAQR
ncbi:MAG: hypothetical protein KDA99_18580 [Planctomycetales bacterium]|nr:hypothetical protein [Planctomycetales bacterium]